MKLSESYWVVSTPSAGYVVLEWAILEGSFDLGKSFRAQVKSNRLEERLVEGVITAVEGDLVRFKDSQDTEWSVEPLTSWEAAKKACFSGRDSFVESFQGDLFGLYWYLYSKFGDGLGKIPYPGKIVLPQW